MTVFGGPPGRDLDFLLILCDIFGIWTKKIEQLGSVTYLPPKLRYLNLPHMQLLMLQDNKYSFAFREFYLAQDSPAISCWEIAFSGTGTLK